MWITRAACLYTSCTYAYYSYFCDDKHLKRVHLILQNQYHQFNYIMCHYLTAYTISKFFTETEAINAAELGFTHNFILNTPNVDHVLWDESVIYVVLF
jgi:hypothetical protein